MTERTEPDRDRLLQDLSALADGEGDRASLLAACARWPGDADLRARWQAYHLIGDVLRSEELAAGAHRDAEFLGALQRRMAQEPTVLAPASPSARPSPGWSWKAPAAVAAGFMAVAGALVVVQDAPTLPGGRTGATLAQTLGGMPATGPVAQGTRVVPAVEPQALVADGQLVRDARLQRYFAAHQQFDGTSALGASSGFLRAATSRTPER